MIRFLIHGLVALMLGISTAGAATTVGFVTGAGGLGDDAFTDVTYAGVRRAQQKYGFNIIVEKPDTAGTISEKAFIQVIKRSDILILLGAQHIEIARKFAARYPAKKFINFDDLAAPKANLVSIVIKQHEGSFLVGALAGWMTQSKKVGFIGGTDFDAIHAFRVSFAEGVRYADKSVELVEAFVKPDRDASGFADPQKAHSLAGLLYRDGVDIIYAVAGPSGNGVIQAARDYRKYVIGVDTDQDHMAKGLVLTSMLKRLDMAVFKELSNIMEGRFVSGLKFYGLKENGVGLSPMNYTRHLFPEKILKKIKETEKSILNGDIQVTDYLQNKAR